VVLRAAPVIHVRALDRQEGECRHGFPQMQDVLGKLVAALKRYSPEEVLDMDNIMSRESLDVIGVPHHISICSETINAPAITKKS
jgi:hypothetical protein